MMEMKTVRVGQPVVPTQPPYAIVLIVNPGDGKLQVQWPPGLDIAVISQLLTDAARAVQNTVRTKSGGLVLPGEVRLAGAEGNL